VTRGVSLINDANNNNSNNSYSSKRARPYSPFPANLASYDSFFLRYKRCITNLLARSTTKTVTSAFLFDHQTATYLYALCYRGFFLSFSFCLKKIVIVGGQPRSASPSAYNHHRLHRYYSRFFFGFFFQKNNYMRCTGVCVYARRVEP